MSKPSLLRSSARWLNPLMPFTRVADQVRESGSRIAQLRREVAAKKAAREAAVRLPGATGAVTTPAEARKRGMDLFEAHVQANGWTEAGLERQLLVIRLSRVAGVFGVALTMALVILAVVKVPIAFLPIALIVLGLALSFQLVMTAKIAKWQLELEERRLYTGDEFWARRDLFRRLFLIRFRKVQVDA